MTHHEHWIFAAYLIASVCGAFGAWTVHARLRSRSSLTFAVSFCALMAWVPVFSVIEMPLANALARVVEQPLSAYGSVMKVKFTVALVLTVIVSVSFLRAVWSVARHKARGAG